MLKIQIVLFIQTIFFVGSVFCLFVSVQPTKFCFFFKVNIRKNKTTTIKKPLDN